MNEHDLSRESDLDEASITIGIWIDRIVKCAPLVILIAAVIVAVRVWL